MDYFAVILSRHSVRSEWVQRELQVAMQRELQERKVVVLPLLLEAVEMPPFLRDKLYADFTTPENCDATFPKLLEALGAKAHTPPSNPLEAVQPSGTAYQTPAAGTLDRGVLNGTTEITIRANLDDCELIGDDLPKKRLKCGGDTKFEVAPGRYSFYVSYYKCIQTGYHGNALFYSGESQRWEGVLKPGKYRFECGEESNALNTALNVFKSFIPLATHRVLIYLKQVLYEPWAELTSSAKGRGSG